MDALLPEVMSRLTGDATLGGLTTQINLFANPSDPKAVVGIWVAVATAPGNDEIGLHGAAENVALEVECWAYGYNNIPNAYKAGNRITQLFLAPIRTSDGGLTFRFRSVTSWQKVPEEDSKIIHLQNVFASRYWPTARVSALTA